MTDFVSPSQLSKGLVLNFRTRAARKPSDVSNSTSANVGRSRAESSEPSPPPPVSVECHSANPGYAGRNPGNAGYADSHPVNPADGIIECKATPATATTPTTTDWRVDIPGETSAFSPTTSGTSETSGDTGSSSSSHRRCSLDSPTHPTQSIDQPQPQQQPTTAPPLPTLKASSQDSGIGADDVALAYSSGPPNLAALTSTSWSTPTQSSASRQASQPPPPPPPHHQQRQPAATATAAVARHRAGSPMRHSQLQQQQQQQQSTADGWFGTDAQHVRLIQHQQHRHSTYGSSQQMTMLQQQQQQQQQAAAARCRSSSSTEHPTGPAPPDTDPGQTDTLRRTADRHRAVSRRLFEAMQASSQQRLAKSPSSAGSTSSSSNNSSSYAMVSEGTSFADDPFTRRQLLRSRSTDSFSGAQRYASFNLGSHRLSTASSTQQQQPWNCPQQRRSVLSAEMTAPYETEFPVTPSTSALDPNASMTGSRHERVFKPQSAADPQHMRGAYKKIVNKRQLREENKVFQMRGLPDPPAPPSPVATSFGPCPIAPSQSYDEQEYVALSACRSAAVNNSSGNNRIPAHVRSHSDRPLPIGRSAFTFTPNSEPPQPGPDPHQSSGTADHRPVAGKMRTPPPPLPRKPPPPVMTDSQSAQMRYASTPSLMSAVNQTTSSNSSISTSMSTSRNRLSYNQAQEQYVSPDTVTWHTTNARNNHNYSTNSSQGHNKPMVSVPPMCQSVSHSVSTECLIKATANKLSIENANSKTTRSPSPKVPPPVPKKPAHLQPNRPPPANTEVHITPPTTVVDPCSPAVNGGGSRAEQRQELDSVDAQCNRLSAFVSENDKSLKNILLQRAAPDSLVAHCFAATVSVGNANVSNANNSLSPAHRHERTASSSSGTSQLTEADVRVLNNLYNRKPSSQQSLYSGTSSRTQSPTTDSPDVELGQLDKKKRQLIDSLSRKVSILDEELRAINDEMDSNEKVGDAVRHAYRQAGATDAKLNRVNTHVQETEQITRLLLKLSSQLARVEAALATLMHDPDSASERELLEERRERVCAQLADARVLRDSTSRRGQAVQTALAQLLPEELLTDFVYYVNMKQKLLVDAKEIEEKLQLGRDQLAALELSMEPDTPVAAS